MSIIHGGIIYEDSEAPAWVLLFEVERLRAGVAAERARIREELLDALTSIWARIPPLSNQRAAAAVHSAGVDIRAALDRICPEGPA